MNGTGTRTILEIVKSLFKDLADGVSFQQSIVKSLSRILGLKRITLFHVIGDREERKYRLKIVAGVPIEKWPEEPQPKSAHKDVAMAVDKKEVMVISNPLEAKLTDYFIPKIVEKNIREILYIPLVCDLKKSVVGVIVLDAVEERDKFKEEEIEFCKMVGELISLIINMEESHKQKIRDAFLNDAIPITMFANQIAKAGGQISEAISLLLENASSLDKKCKELKSDF
jgi:hypothetical protein